MTARGAWLPTRYQDERIPTPRGSPDAWIGAQDDGAPALEGDEDYGLGPRPLREGDVVDFDRLHEHGGTTLAVEADGMWSVGRDMPAGAETVCVVGEPDSMADSVAELALDLWRDQRGRGEYRIEYYTWAGPFRLRFEGGRFVPADGDGA